MFSSLNNHTIRNPRPMEAKQMSGNEAIHNDEPIALSATEAETLAGCEKTIRHGVESFWEVGNALATIVEGRLYRATHETFEHYCRDRWGLSKSYAYEQINGATVITALQTSGIPDTPLPTNASQARLLQGLPVETSVHVMKRAEHLAGNQPITSKIIKRAKRESGIRGVSPRGDRQAHGDVTEGSTTLGEGPEPHQQEGDATEDRLSDVLKRAQGLLDAIYALDLSDTRADRASSRVMFNELRDKQREISDAFDAIHNLYRWRDGDARAVAFEMNDRAFPLGSRPGYMKEVREARAEGLVLARPSHRHTVSFDDWEPEV